MKASNDRMRNVNMAFDGVAFRHRFPAVHTIYTRLATGKMIIIRGQNHVFGIGKD